MKKTAAATPAKALSHVGLDGRPHMVDVGGKPALYRAAHASGMITLSRAARRLVRSHQIKKGNVLAAAELAGIQAAKQTAMLIPLCHTLPLCAIDVKAVLTRTGARVTSTVKSHGQTGVEMEALTAVAVALLTIYDMCKAVDHAMLISALHLVQKTKRGTP